MTMGYLLPNQYLQNTITSRFPSSYLRNPHLQNPSLKFLIKIKKIHSLLTMGHIHCHASVRSYHHRGEMLCNVAAVEPGAVVAMVTSSSLSLLLMAFCLGCCCHWWNQRVGQPTLQQFAVAPENRPTLPPKRK